MWCKTLHAGPMLICILLCDLVYGYHGCSRCFSGQEGKRKNQLLSGVELRHSALCTEPQLPEKMKSTKVQTLGASCVLSLRHCASRVVVCSTSSLCLHSSSVTLWTDLAWWYMTTNTPSKRTSFTPTTKKFNGRCSRHVFIGRNAHACFPLKNGRPYVWPSNGGSARSQKRMGFRENPTNFLTFVAR